MTHRHDPQWPRYCAAWAHRCARQQRRCGTVRGDRGLSRGAGSRGLRDQLLGSRAHGPPRAADHARAGQRRDRQHQLDHRSPPLVSVLRLLCRGEACPRGDVRIPRGGGRAVRDPGAVRRAGLLHHRPDRHGRHVGRPARSELTVRGYQPLHARLHEGRARQRWRSSGRRRRRCRGSCRRRHPLARARRRGR